MVVHIYTGDGKGKTTAALGLSLRALGHNKNVFIIQFMKGWKTTGEYKIRKRLGKHFHIYQFGRKGFVNLLSPSKSDILRARKAFEFAKKKLKDADILVLDEIDVAIKFGLVPLKDVVKFMQSIPRKKWVIFTGRYAMKELYEYADYVTEFIDIKRPKEKLKARKGIEW